MSDGKGKGRAVAAEDNKTTSEQSTLDPGSLLGRVKSSAAGLVRNTFTAPSSSELSTYDSTVISGPSKSGRASGNYNSAWAETPGTTQPSTLQSPQVQPHSSLRREHTEEHIQRSETEFSSFLSGIDAFRPTSEAVPEAALAAQQETAESQRVSGLNTTSLWDTSDVSHHGSIQEQQEHDGDDVSTILGRRSNQDDLSHELPLVSEDVDWGLTDQQILSLRPVLDELFPPPPPHVSPAPDHPLNLVPSLASSNTTPEFISRAHSDQELRVVQPSSGVIQETELQVWIDNWAGVLTRYTDEVWGGLLPLVVKARQEVEAIKENPQGAPGEQSGALRRLQLILDHLRSQQ